MKRILLLIIFCSFFYISCNKDNKPVTQNAKQEPQKQNSQQAITPVKSGLINPDGSVTLKYNVNKGDKFELEMFSDQKITQEAQGKKQEANQAQGFGYNFIIEDVDGAGNISSKITFSSIYNEIDAGMGKIIFDSKNPPKVENPQTKIFMSLIGKGFTAKQSPVGNVIDIKGIDDIIKGIVKKMDLKNANEDKALSYSLEAQFGKSRMVDLLEKTMNFYSAEPRKIGDKWTKDYNINAEFNMLVSSEYTLKEIKGTTIILGVTSKMHTDPKSKTTENNGVIVNYNLKGTKDGTIEIDAASGLIIKSDVKQKISGNITAVSSDKDKKTESVKISLDSKNTIKTTKSK
jgi:hypothetical protein